MNGSLYLHVPFCTKKCHYCNFYVIPNKPHLQKLYMKALEQEWLMRGKPQNPVTIYFGGGTPALLGPEKIGTILSWVGTAEEITLEVNPENVTLPLMQAYRKVGINRLSLGVQSLATPQLYKLGRTHDAPTATRALEICHRAGFDNISVDVMYDLPGQTIEELQMTLRSLAGLPITHISLYNLTIEPHTHFFKHRPQQPSEELSLELLECALANIPFPRYEISAFAKPGFESKHNTGYWTNRPFLGLGPAAFSYIEGKRFANVAHLNRYAKKLEQGELPTDFEEKLSPEKSLRERLAIGLRMLAGVDLREFVLDRELEETIASLCSEDLLEKRDQMLKLSSKGTTFYDHVACCFV